MDFDEKQLKEKNHLLVKVLIVIQNYYHETDQEMDKIIQTVFHALIECLITTSHISCINSKDLIETLHSERVENTVNILYDFFDKKFKPDPDDIDQESYREAAIIFLSNYLGVDYKKGE